ncbi:MAG: hypothetical protein MUF15_01355 [Acidobacteria bacterium]|jgi:hypothetical protein|nr:hypothetical protein [Acidobacteriota bacterium]
MKRAKKIHGHTLIKVPESQVPEDLILYLEMQANTLIETVLKPSFVSTTADVSAATGNTVSYITNIYSKWEDYYFYFYAEYTCAGFPLNSVEQCLSECKFARLEYVGDIRFNLSYMSQSGKWEKIFIDLTIDECMEAIRNESFFYPC